MKSEHHVNKKCTLTLNRFTRERKINFPKISPFTVSIGVQKVRPSNRSVFGCQWSARESIQNVRWLKIVVFYFNLLKFYLIASFERA